MFDYVCEGIDVPCACRVKELERLPRWEHVEKVRPVVSRNADELASYEEESSD